jgi:RNA polymerase sigma-70 factor, ECF subfamily
MTGRGDRGRRRHAVDATDAELVTAAQAGDRAALEQLLRRHHDQLHLLCRRLCRDRGDAEDATQQALMAIVRGLPRYDGRAAFATWAYRVTTNACLDELRRRARRPQLARVDDLAAADGVHGALPDATAVDPGEAAVGVEERSRLQVALDGLDESFRVPVVLRDVADLDYAEIGELLDLPAGTVRSRISRGRAKLAALLAGNQAQLGDVRTDEAP